jgi:choline dehydrogenase-like flavoprotein
VQVAERVETTAPDIGVAALALTVSDAAAASQFFRAALDFDVSSEEANQAGAVCRSVTLRLCREVINLDEHRPPGRPVPADSRSYDLWFQHLAIVVSDIRAACDRLDALGIRYTSPAPQRLPEWHPSAGGIQASYIRDPDGHPLEVISFPSDKGDALSVERDGNIRLSYTPTHAVPKAQLYDKLKSMLNHLGLHQHLVERNLYLKNDIEIGGVAHQAGTCRFGRDPRTSVLDTNCKAHGLDNLYVVDTSFFPSIGAVNPALTAMANAIRVGDHLQQRLQ